MMGRTHLLLGLNTLWLLQPLGTSESLPLLTLAVALGTLLPDLDAPNSLLQGLSVGGVRPFVLPARAIAPFGHRGILHSLSGMLLTGVLSLPFATAHIEILLAFLLGYASHLAADACTRSGIRLLYPNPRRFHLLPRCLWLTTGSQAEEVIFVIAACSLLTLMLNLSPF